jgi:hypothetical protein
MQSVPITTGVVSSNIDQGELYNIIHDRGGKIKVKKGRIYLLQEDEGPQKKVSYSWFDIGQV